MGSKDDRTKCYGNFEERRRCHKCMYCASCKWYSNNPITTARTGFMGSIPNIDQLPDYALGLPDTPITLRDLATFAKYLLTLTDLELGVLQQVISGARSIADLAVSAGKSKQTLHKNIIDTIAKHPELGVLFATLMPKLTVARSRFLRNKMEVSDSK